MDMVPPKAFYNEIAGIFKDYLDRCRIDFSESRGFYFRRDSRTASYFCRNSANYLQSFSACRAGAGSAATPVGT
jgi:hypothetical protein